MKQTASPWDHVSRKEVPALSLEDATTTEELHRSDAPKRASLRVCWTRRAKHLLHDDNDHAM